MHANPVYFDDRHVWHLADEAGATWAMDDQQFPHVLLTGTPDGMDAGFWLWGWHFDSRDVLLATVAAWDPATMDEPLGFLKRKGEHRQAPRREELPEYNRPRCPHGYYDHLRDCPLIACGHWTR